jgi:hypothetical protein
MQDEQSNTGDMGMSIYVRRFANGFLLNDEGARVEEGRLYLDELDLIEAVAKKLGIDLDAHCLSELSKPEPPTESPTDSEPESDEPVDPQEFKRFHAKSAQRTLADKAREATLLYAESVANAIPETD